MWLKCVSLDINFVAFRCGCRLGFAFPPAPKKKSSRTQTKSVKKTEESSFTSMKNLLRELAEKLSLKELLKMIKELLKDSKESSGADMDSEETEVD